MLFRSIVNCANNANGLGVACDSSGNVYLAGFYAGLGGASLLKEDGTSIFPGYFTPNTSSQAGFVTKFDSSGAFLFSRIFDSASSEQCNSITCDSDNNFYVSGITTSTSGFSVFSEKNMQLKLLSINAAVGFTSKFDKNGVYQYTHIIGTNSYGITCDSNNNLYISGAGAQTTQYRNEDNLILAAYTNSSATQMGYVVKFESSSAFYNTPEFIYAIDSNQYDATIAVYADSNNNYYSGGYCGNVVTMTTTNSNVVANINISVSPAQRIGIFNKYNSLGVYQFSRILASSTNNQSIIYKITCDSSGNIYIAGLYGGKPTFYTQSGNPFSPTVSLPISSGNSTGFMSKFDSSGNHIFSRIIDSSGDDSCSSLCIDSSSNIFVCGYCTGTPTIYDENGTPLATFTSAFAGQAGFVCKFNISGGFLMGLSVDSSGADGCNSVDVDSSGNIYIAGYYTTGAATIRTEIPSTTIGTLAAPGSAQAGFLIKIDSSNVFQYGRVMDGSGSNDVFSSVRCDSAGNIYAAGTYTTATIKDAPGTTTYVTLPTTLNQRSGIVIKFNSAGTYQFFRVVNSSTQACVGSSVDVSSKFMVFSGWYNGAAVLVNNYNSTIITFPTSSGAAGYAVKFDLAGTYLNQSARFIDSTTNSESIEACAMDKDGNCLLGGYYYTTALNIKNPAGTTLNTMAAGTGTGTQTSIFLKANI